MPSTKIPRPSAEAVVTLLRDGNQRFQATASDASFAEMLPPNRRSHPLAAVICCSDCHVAPERLFGLSAGELLVLPTPGSRVSLSEAMAFRCAHQIHGVDCAIVLGHTGCPTMEAVRRYGMEGGLLTRLVATEVAQGAMDARTTDELEICMVQRMADRLLELLEKSPDLVVLPALFDASTRSVEFLGVT